MVQQNDTVDVLAKQVVLLLSKGAVDSALPKVREFQCGVGNVRDMGRDGNYCLIIADALQAFALWREAYEMVLAVVEKIRALNNRQNMIYVLLLERLAYLGQQCGYYEDAGRFHSEAVEIRERDFQESLQVLQRSSSLFMRGGGGDSTIVEALRGGPIDAVWTPQLLQARRGFASRLWAGMGRYVGGMLGLKGDKAVQFSVFGPARLAPSETGFVQVYVHIPAELSLAHAYAVSFDAQTHPRGQKKLDMPVSHGARLLFQLQVPGLIVAEAMQGIIWRGAIDSVQFSVYAPSHQPAGACIGTVTVLMNGLPVGQLKLKIEINNLPKDCIELGSSHEVNEFKRAYVLCAGPDRVEAARWIGLMSSLGIHYQLDMPALSHEKRLELIAKSDLVLSCCSRAMVESGYVWDSVRYALSLRESSAQKRPEVRLLFIEPLALVNIPADIASLCAEDYLPYMAMMGDLGKGAVVNDPRNAENETVLARVVSSNPGDLRSGDLVDGYQIGEKLGQGAFGLVFRARDRILQRDVAIKFLHSRRPELPEHAFRIEARLLASAGRHPSVVQIYSWANWQEHAYFVMEYLPGNMLHYLEKHPRGIPWPEVVGYGIELADAVSYAHKMGIVHQDIKPANVLYDEELRRVKLADFGMARLTLGMADGAMPVGGTPSYMAPEQIDGESNPLTDIYSLGVTLYELLCGEKAFGGADVRGVFRAIKLGNRRLLSERCLDIPEAVASAVERAIDPDPERRYGSACAFSMALREVQSLAVAV